MAKIAITDLNASQELDREAMRVIYGGARTPRTPSGRGQHTSTAGAGALRSTTKTPLLDQARAKLRGWQ